MDSEKERITGQIDRITYTNEENGFTVARLKLLEEERRVTVVGNLPAPDPGQVVELDGYWTTHSKYGRQFKITDFRYSAPTSEEGVKRYLGSGLIPGIGPVMAERIVNKFGREALEIIDDNPEKLKEVEGIGRKRLQQIQESWQEQSEIREIMVFLLSNNISPAYAARIYQEYGRDAVDIVQNKPYRLASDVWGIGFQTVDKIARDMGIEKDSPQRLKAGLIYIMEQTAGEGHVYYPYEALLERTARVLEVEREQLVEAFGELEVQDSLIIEDLNFDYSNFTENNKAVYLKAFYVAETGINWKIQQLLASARQQYMIDIPARIREVDKQLTFSLAGKQRQAVELALKENLLVITGGPGTGKTTIIEAIISTYRELNQKILLAAPTGRAAKRMTEATGKEAKTVHRLLEFSYQEGGFQRNGDNQLAGDVIIIDEASMLDTVLMYHLLKAVPESANLILVGDVNQLPPVGAGYVLRDIIRSGRVPVIELTEIFRQAQESSIVINSHRINNGQMPALQNKTSSSLDDFYFVEEKEPAKVLQLIIKIVRERVPARFDFDPVEDVQVLSPMRRGELGTENLNCQLQDILNPALEAEGLSYGGVTYRVNDKVMQVKNNYDLDVFNGDIGRIVAVDKEGSRLTIDYDGRLVNYERTNLEELELAYAITVHKSQGSEYPVIVFPMVTQHYIMLQRNLLYTALTRGRQLAVIIGSKKALAMAVNNDKVEERYSLLEERLRDFRSTESD